MFLCSVVLWSSLCSFIENVVIEREKRTPASVVGNMMQRPARSARLNSCEGQT